MTTAEYERWHPFANAKHGWRNTHIYSTAKAAALQAERCLEQDPETEVLIHPYGPSRWAVYYRLGKDRPA